MRGEVLLDRGGDQAVGEALAVGAEQAGGQQRVAGRGQLADGDAGDGRDHVRQRAVAETASAAATARSRGASVASRQRMTLRAMAETGGASTPARSIDSGPCAAIWRPSSPSSHGLPPTARWQSRHTAAEVSGARRRMSCAAPRGVSRCGCSTVADRTPPSRLSRSDGARGSSARAPTAMSSGRSSIRRAR